MATDLGAVFVLAADGATVARLHHARASSACAVELRSAAAKAYAAGGYAIIGQRTAGGAARPPHGVVVVPGQAPDAPALRALLAHGGNETAGLSAPGAQAPALPVLVARHAAAWGVVATHSDEHEHGNAHSARSRDRRASRLVLGAAVAHATAEGGSPHERGREIAEWTSALQQGVYTEPLPFATDYARVAALSGWPLPPYTASGMAAACPRQARAPSFLKFFHAPSLLRRVAEARGYGHRDDDPIVRLAAQTYCQEFSFSSLGAAVMAELRGGPRAALPPPATRRRLTHDEREAARLGRALSARRAVGGGPLYLDHEPVAGEESDRLYLALTKLAETGAFRELTDAEAADPTECLIVSPAKIALKDTGLLPSDGLAAACLASPAELARWCDALAGSVLADAAARRAAGASAQVAVEEALGAAMSDPKGRFVIGMSAVSRTMLAESSFRYPTLRSMLGQLVSGRRLFKIDARSFFYCFAISRRVRALCCVRVRYHGRVVFFQAQASVMGVRPSPGVATCASAWTVSSALMDHHERRAPSRGWAARPLLAAPPPDPAGSSADAYVDDCIGAGVGEHSLDLHDTVGAYLATADVERAAGEDKCFPPASEGPVLGRFVDLARRQVSLPAPKAALYMVHALVAYGALDLPALRAGVTAPMVRTVCGRLGWWAALCPRGAAHLQRLGAAGLLGVPPAVMAAGVRRDLGWWRDAWLEGELHPLQMLGPAAGRAVHLIASDAGDFTFAGEVHGRRGWRAVWGLLGPADAAPASTLRREAIAFEATAALAERELPFAPGALWVGHTDSDGLFRGLNRRATAGCDDPRVDAALVRVHDSAGRAGATLLAVHDPRESPLIAPSDMLTTAPSLAAARALYSRLRGPDAEVEHAG